MSVSQSQRWFQCFRSGNYSLEDESRSGRPQEFDDEILRALIDQNPTLTIEDLSKQLQTTHSTIYRQLSDMNLKQRIEICNSHL